MRLPPGSQHSVPTRSRARSAGVNPSLTIAANALRIGSHLAGRATPVRARRALPIHDHVSTHA